mmetsp:Transcript_484/g.923  ORF Transcript_484/g.923 Transcript_484/m.923 type:complete len:96 (+) Transcript_484:95-382(+)
MPRRTGCSPAKRLMDPPTPPPGDRKVDLREESREGERSVSTKSDFERFSCPPRVGLGLGDYSSSSRSGGVPQGRNMRWSMAYLLLPTLSFSQSAT